MEVVLLSLWSQDESVVQVAERNVRPFPLQRGLWTE
jgi:hypothetical protein